MIGYLTEIDIKRGEVRTTFRKDTNTFSFGRTFPLGEALKVAAEFMDNRITEWLAQVLDSIEQKETGRGVITADGLKERFPWLGTDEHVDCPDAVSELMALYFELRGKAESGKCPHCGAPVTETGCSCEAVN